MQFECDVSRSFEPSCSTLKRRAADAGGLHGGFRAEETEVDDAPVFVEENEANIKPPQNLCVKKKKQKHRVDPDAFWVAAVAAWPVASYSTMRNIAVNQFQQDQPGPLMSIDPSLIVAHTRTATSSSPSSFTLHPASSIRTFVPPLCQPIPSSNRAGRGPA